MASSERGRWPAALLVGAASTLLSLTSGAQQARPALPAPPLARPPAAVAATPAPAVAAPVAEPAQEPPYDPAEHQGVSEAAWLIATRGTARRSTGMMISGIGFITLGASLLAAGTGVFVNDNGCQGFNNGCNGGRVTGMAILATGLIALGLGIPLTIHGATDVPRAEAGSARRDDRSPATTGSPVGAPSPPEGRPQVTLGLAMGGAALALHF